MLRPGDVEETYRPFLLRNLENVMRHANAIRDVIHKTETASRITDRSSRPLSWSLSLPLWPLVSTRTLAVVHCGCEYLGGVHYPSVQHSPT